MFMNICEKYMCDKCNSKSCVKWQPMRILEIMPIESEKDKGYCIWGDDANIVMFDTFTPDTNDVGKFKVKIRELKVALGRLVHEKDISERKVLNKVEELTEEIKELRREVKVKHMEKKNEEEEEEHKDVEKQERMRKRKRSRRRKRIREKGGQNRVDEGKEGEAEG